MLIIRRPAARRRPRSFLYSAFCSLAVGLCSAGIARAQFKAGIAGTVTDSSGAAVSGVTITVTNQETGKSQQVTTGDAGFYRVSGLSFFLNTAPPTVSSFLPQPVQVLH